MKNKFVTQNGRLWNLREKVCSILWVQDVHIDYEALNIVINRYLTKRRRGEMSYLSYAPKVVELYKSYIAWDNGLVEYILNVRHNETANHIGQ